MNLMKHTVKSENCYRGFILNRWLGIIEYVHFDKRDWCSKTESANRFVVSKEEFTNLEILNEEDEIYFWKWALFIISSKLKRIKSSENKEWKKN